MGDGEFPTVDGQTTFTLTIPLGGDGSDPVTVQADLGVSVNPTVGISRDDNGTFHFHVGANDFLSRDLPHDIQQWYQNLNRRATARRGSKVRMISCASLLRMAWSTYDTTRRIWYTPAYSLNGEIWPYLPPIVFDALQRRCATRPASGG